MKRLILVSFVIFTVFSGCPIYAPGNNFATDQCFLLTQANDDVVNYVRKCNDSKVCNYASQELDLPVFCEYPKFLPGFACDVKENCTSNICEKKVCVGLAEGKNCYVNQDCDAGLYCDKTCKKLAVLNEKCSTSVPCRWGYICWEGKCREIASLKKGEASTNSLLCHSLYINDKGVCEDGPKASDSLSKAEYACPANGVCEYTGGVKQACKCGITNAGIATFCAKGAGDVTVKDVRKNHI